MTKQPFRFTFFVLICLSIPLMATAQTVNIPDLNLRVALENTLDKASGEPITASEMATLTNLRARNANITDLTGLESATNLIRLNLDGEFVQAAAGLVNSNSISDLSPLAGLNKLAWLNLRSNSLSDISPLAGLTNLTRLDLRSNLISDISPLAELYQLTQLLLNYNSITDISPLAGLNKLTDLSLKDNSISDISPLAGLYQLTDLSLARNLISDISSLAGLTNLTGLSLHHNSITDISPLAGLYQLTWLWLSRNSITDISPLAGKNELTSLLLDYNSITDISSLTGLYQLTTLWLSNNSITDISPLAGLNKLTQLLLNHNFITDISPLAGLNELTSLWLSRNSITDISPLAGKNELTSLLLDYNFITDISLLVENTGLGKGDSVDVRRNPLNALSINTHIPALQNRGVIVEFDNIVVQPEVPAQTVDIPDPNLRAVIEKTLRKASGKTITTTEIANLIFFSAAESNISDLTGLEHATNLTWLLLDSNTISDISAVANLINLAYLGIEHNNISDISPVVGLNRLTYLFLRDNNISDISPVAGLNQLTQLLLTSNSITDISPLARLYQLTDLALDNNSISDISPVAGLNQLTGLDLRYNSISDISPLVENTGLGDGDAVNVKGNPLSTLSINTHIPALQSRGVLVEFDNTVARPVDVNGDGVVNILDLVSVASHFGKQGQNLTADVNRDGIVNILDLVLVAGRFGKAAAAPLAHPQTSEILTAAEVRQWLTDAKTLEIQDPIMERGVMLLQQLLASLTPTATQLLPNYPNPFNPETWIPYRLAEDVFVTLTIYDQTGQVVRTIDIGHQTAAFYENRSQAIYWDGRNEIGEKVASGVYLYTLTAGDFSATRKMLILK